MPYMAQRQTGYIHHPRTVPSATPPASVGTRAIVYIGFDIQTFPSSSASTGRWYIVLSSWERVTRKFTRPELYADLVTAEHSVLAVTTDFHDLFLIFHHFTKKKSRRFRCCLRTTCKYS